MSENPSTWGELAGLTLTKGHGTSNDFIFVTDENSEIALTPDLAAAGRGASGSANEAVRTDTEVAVAGAGDQVGGEGNL